MATGKQITLIRQLDLDLAMLMDQLHSQKSYEDILMIPDQAHQALFLQQLESLKQRIDLIEDSDEVMHFFIHHFHDVIDNIQWDQSRFFSHPEVLFQQVLHTAQRLVKTDSRRPKLRKQHLDAQWNSLADCLNTLEGAQHCTALCTQLLKQGENLAKEQWITESTYRKVKEALHPWIRDTVQPQTVRSLQDRLNTDPKEYEQMLKMKMGIDLQEMRGWVREQNDLTRKRVYDLANQLSDTPITSMIQVRQLLDEKAGACSSAEEMFERGHSYLERVRKISKEILWSPIDEICDLTAVPEELKDSFPWGGYMDGCPYERPLHGRMFLNETNYTAVTDGWIKINTVHEAYFGHHIQFLRINSDPLPETMCRNIKADALVEGTAHRSEHVYESIFPEDPYYPLFTAYRRHHTSVRVLADLWLRYENRTIKEVVDLYCRELGFDEKTARGQVLAQEQMFGYFTCYCYGLRKIEQFEKELNLKADEMTRLLFDCGQISIDSLELFLRCSEDSRWSITHDFPSLMRFA